MGKDEINIIDWLNSSDANKLYDISKVMDDILAKIRAIREEGDKMSIKTDTIFYGNPYHLSDTDGGVYNQYPEFQIWEDGRKAGIREAVEWILSKQIQPVYEIKLDYMMTQRLKEWGIK